MQISKRRRQCAIALACLGPALLCARASAQLRAFGEAEGFGAIATGGRGGTIYHVTNLSNSGSGSFRDAVSASNRIIVFDVGGVINLTSATSGASNLTIAGQTAPGGGITINGYQAIGLENDSNVIMRHLRFRPGDGSPAGDNCVSLLNAQTVIIDHVSMEFAKWNNVDAVCNNGNAPQMTIQHSIIADPISTGNSNTGQGFGAHLESLYSNYTLSNNLWVNSHNRNPLAKVNEQFKNNIEYNNEAGYTTNTSSTFDHDLVNNAFIWGPSSSGNSQRSCCSGLPNSARSSMLPVSGAAQLNASGPSTGDRPMSSARGAYWRLVRPPPCSWPVRKRFHRPRSRAWRRSSATIGGVDHASGCSSSKRASSASAG